MARYFWDISFLKRDLDKLLHAMNNEDDPLKKHELSRCYDIVNSIIYQEFVSSERMVSFPVTVADMYQSYLLEQRYFELLEVFLDPIEKNLDLYNQCSDGLETLEDVVEKATAVHVGREKAISLCHEFYQNLDEELYASFKPFYDDRFSHLRFKKEIHHDAASFTCGRSHFLYGLGTNYVQILGKDNPEMVMTLIHESAHVIDNKMNPEAYLKETYFYEVISLFMEFVSFYQRVGHFDELFYHGQKIKRLSSFFADANAGSDLGLLMSVFKENEYNINSDFYKLAKSEYNFSKREVKETLLQSNYDDIVYPISFTLAMYFFHIYKQDKKQGLLELKQFLKTIDRDQYIPFILSSEMSSVLEEEVHDTMQSTNQVFSKKIKELGRR